MTASNSPYVPNIQDWWIGYYGKQVVCNNISQEEHNHDKLLPHIDEECIKKQTITCGEQKGAEQVSDVYDQDKTSSDMSDTALVSPVQGVVQQARAIKRHRTEVKSRTDNAKRRRKVVNKRKKKNTNKRGKRAIKKRKNKRRSKKKTRKKKTNTKRGNRKKKKKNKGKKKKKNKGGRRIKKEKQRDIFN